MGIKRKVEEIKISGSGTGDSREILHEQGVTKRCRIFGPANSTLVSEQGWAKLVLIALERYSVALKRLTFNLR